MATTSSKAVSLKEYLKRYEAGNEDEIKKKKKKKKSKPVVATGVVVVDEDPTWQNPIKFEESDVSEDEEKPVVDEDIEVKRMKRLEQLKAKRPFGVISDDGSGWISVPSSTMNPKIQDSDNSPPHKQGARNDTPSPEPKTKFMNKEVADLSPPRKQKKIHETPSPEFEMETLGSPRSKRRARCDTPSPRPEVEPSESGQESKDLSPVRKHQRHDHFSSAEPKGNPSKSTFLDHDLSPPRRSHPKKSGYDSKKAEQLDVSGVDLSPPRRSKKDRHALTASDLSPPRRKQKELSSIRKQAKTGLISGQDIKEENSRIKKEDWLKFQEMNPSMSGRNAEPVYRDKITGERMSKEQILKSRKKEDKPKEIKLEWGKGLAQRREAEEELRELELEMDKPFARTRDDPELDTMLKERVRWGDPMAHLVKRKLPEPILPDLGNDEKMKESGFVIPQEIPSHSWIKRCIDAAPNRYGIKPGRHWDGVDRSSGFEKQLFKRMNEKRATETEAYLWSVSDM